MFSFEKNKKKVFAKWNPVRHFYFSEIVQKQIETSFKCHWILRHKGNKKQGNKQSSKMSSFLGEIPKGVFFIILGFMSCQN